LKEDTAADRISQLIGDFMNLNHPRLNISKDH